MQGCLIIKIIDIHHLIQHSPRHIIFFNHTHTQTHTHTHTSTHTHTHTHTTQHNRILFGNFILNLHHHFIVLLGPSIKYVTLFLANFDPPPPPLHPFPTT